jgi:putative oxidoreductase
MPRILTVRRPGTFVYPNAWNEHLVWASILLFLLARGGGALSLDFLIAGRLGLKQ